jgi:putative endonuclease
MMKILNSIRDRLFGRFDPLKLTTAEFGSWAENKAKEFLLKKGYELITQNFRINHGEVDLIMRDEDTLVFVEVKATRSIESEPHMKVNHDKRRRIITAARSFIARHNFYDMTARFDIITVKVNSEHQPCIEHESDAFQSK